MPEPMSGCWLWFCGVNEHGYGVFWNGSRIEKAHRFSLRAYRTGPTEDQDVRHNCDNPACVNPDHLLIGLTQDNVDDMWRRKRATVQIRRGTAQTQAKLNDDKAAAIRRRYATGRWTQYELADEFGVSQAIVWMVIHGKLWTAPSGVVVERGRGR